MIILSWNSEYPMIAAESVLTEPGVGHSDAIMESEPNNGRGTKVMVSARTIVTQ